MSGSKGMRRAVAEVRWDNDPGMVSWVGNRPVHQYWPMISSYFRDLLLPPQRRADENVVTWTWQEPSHLEPLIPSELRGLRRRLESEQQLFVENLARAGAGTGGVGPKGQVNVDELGAVMGQVVSQLVACTDADLATFLCRTDHGLRIHSWGAAKAASPRFPDTKGLEIAGRVMVGGKPGLHDVILESGDGEHLAETPSDATGAFQFPKLVPGKYRLRARSTRGTFPPNGLAVVLNRTSVTDIILADRDAPAATTPRGRRSRRSASRATLLAIAGGLAILLAGGTWFWLDRTPNNATSPLDVTVANAGGQQPTKAARTDEKRGSAAIDPVASKASVRSADAVSRVPDRGDSVASVSSAISPSVTARKLERRDPFDASPEPDEDYLSRTAARRPDSSGLALNPGTASAEAAGIAPPSATSNQAGASSQSPTGAGSAVDAALAASPTAGVSVPAAAAAGGVGAITPASPTETPALTAVSPSSSPMASPPAPATPPTSQPSSPSGTVATSPQPEVDLQPKAVLATNESSAPVPPAATADSPVAEKVESDVKDLSSAAKAKSKVTTSPTNPASRETDEMNDDDPARRTQEDRADRERVPANRISSLSLFAGSRVALPSTLNLTRTVRVRLSPWKLQLLEDTILPTQPLRAGQVESVSVLRQRLFAEQRARLPVALRESEVLNGVVVVVPRDRDEGSGSLAWRDHSGAVAGGSRVVNGRAEIVWSAENAPVEHPFRLTRGNGEVLAEVRQEAATRELVVRTTEDVRAWLRWIVRAASADDNFSSGATAEADISSPRFSWRTSTGGPVPPGWLPGGEGAGADHQLDLPIGGSMGSVALQRYALFDRISGWALVAESRQAADRPLSE